ncbi:MAG TPA: hypothetical protein VMF62_13435 [Acetobacteraceae bacterium]|nr:hypothetical protein [Acetobacteraceae bacterium]
MTMWGIQPGRTWTAEELREKQATEEREWAQQRAQAARQAAIQKWAERGAGAVLEEIERHGAVRIGEDGALVYSGNHLGDELLAALRHHGAAIRRSLRERWHNRVILDAPEPSAPAT